MSLVYFLVPLETVFVKTGKIQGRCDSKLSERASWPIADLKRILKELSLQAAYISPQERAILTANLCDLDIKGEQEALLDWDFGLFEAQRSFLLPQLENDDYGDFFSKYGYQGETAEVVESRIRLAVQTLLAKEQTAKLLCISGEHAIYNFYLRHTGDARNLQKVDFTPGSLHAFQFNENSISYKRSYFPSLTIPASNNKESEYVQW